MNQNLVVQTLRNLSDTVYYVGGYVRDKFSGVVSKDVDIAADLEDHFRSSQFYRSILRDVFGIVPKFNDN